ncbi:MAG: hypothetical protein NVS2B8_15550 [Vulcanimicrobiaceae bacterium]
MTAERLAVLVERLRHDSDETEFLRLRHEFCGRFEVDAAGSREIAERRAPVDGEQKPPLPRAKMHRRSVFVEIVGPRDRIEA